MFIVLDVNDRLIVEIGVFITLINSDISNHCLDGLFNYGYVIFSNNYAFIFYCFHLIEPIMLSDVFYCKP